LILGEDGMYAIVCVWLIIFQFQRQEIIMTKEEIMINRLKNRRNRIIGITATTFLAILMSCALVIVIYHGKKIDASITPEYVRTMASFENPKTELPELFCWFYALAKYSAKTMYYEMHSAFLIGLLISLIIIQAADLTRRRLFISMWDKIHDLEQEVAKLKGHPKSDG
jgi:hypothetical protein